MVLCPAFEQLVLAGRDPLDFSCVMGYCSEVPQKSPAEWLTIAVFGILAGEALSWESEASGQTSVFACALYPTAWPFLMVAWRCVGMLKFMLQSLGLMGLERF